MAKIVVGTFLTLDGVMQAPGDVQEDTEGGFKYGGWQMSYFDQDAGKIMDQTFADVGGLLIGRKTYQIFAAFWPNAPADDPTAKKMNSLPKYVASTTLKSLDWSNSTLLKGDVIKEVAKLKEQPREGYLWIVGSGKLAQSLMPHDLIDEYVLWYHPIILGTGKRLFPEGTGPLNLKLVDSKKTASGVMVLTYRPGKKA